MADDIATSFFTFVVQMALASSQSDSRALTSLSSVKPVDSADDVRSDAPRAVKFADGRLESHYRRSRPPGLSHTAGEALWKICRTEVACVFVTGG